MISARKRERFCSIEPKKLAEVADWVEPFRKMWEDRFDRVDQIIKKLNLFSRVSLAFKFDLILYKLISSVFFPYIYIKYYNLFYATIRI